MSQAKKRSPGRKPGALRNMEGHPIFSHEAFDQYLATAGENEFWFSAGVSQSRGLSAKARVYWGFFRSRKPAENISRGATGGGASQTRNLSLPALQGDFVKMQGDTTFCLLISV